MRGGVDSATVPPCVPSSASPAARSPCGARSGRPAAAAAHAVVPDDYGELATRTVVTGACLRDDQKADGRLDYCMVSRATPDHVHSPARNTKLIPAPLPGRPEEFPSTSTGLIARDLGGVIPRRGRRRARRRSGLGRQRPRGGQRPGHRRAGIYWHYQVHATAHWDWIPDGASGRRPRRRVPTTTRATPGPATSKGAGGAQRRALGVHVVVHLGRAVLRHHAGECPVTPARSLQLAADDLRRPVRAGLRERSCRRPPTPRQGGTRAPAADDDGRPAGAAAEFAKGRPMEALLDRSTSSASCSTSVTA